MMPRSQKFSSENPVLVVTVIDVVDIDGGIGVSIFRGIDGYFE
jgi:hypothetical protein